jgi:ferredoxin
LSNVAVTLSGMNNKNQLLDNISSFDPIIPLSKEELEALDKVVDIICSCNTIPCTSCRYCVEECPKEIDIPRIFQQYNDYQKFNVAARLDYDYFAFIPEEKNANVCIKCRKCVKKCPQNIDIPLNLKMVHDKAVSLSIGMDLDKVKKSFAIESEVLFICFGAGSLGSKIQSILSRYGYTVSYFCDNDNRKWNNQLNGITIISPSQLDELNKKSNIIVLITSPYYKEIEAQLVQQNITVLDARM